MSKELSQRARLSITTNCMKKFLSIKLFCSSTDNNGIVAIQQSDHEHHHSDEKRGT
jgi:hypothetical protein